MMIAKQSLVKPRVNERFVVETIIIHLQKVQGDEENLEACEHLRGHRRYKAMAHEQGKINSAVMKICELHNLRHRWEHALDMSSGRDIGHVRADAHCGKQLDGAAPVCRRHTSDVTDSIRICTDQCQ